MEQLRQLLQSQQGTKGFDEVLFEGVRCHGTYPVDGYAITVEIECPFLRGHLFCNAVEGS
ncbi:hypothetical protein D3C78_1240230 [compost metagenome]